MKPIFFAETERSVKGHWRPTTIKLYKDLCSTGIFYQGIVSYSVSCTNVQMHPRPERLLEQIQKKEFKFNRSVKNLRRALLKIIKKEEADEIIKRVNQSSSVPEPLSEEIGL